MVAELRKINVPGKTKEFRQSLATKLVSMGVSDRYEGQKLIGFLSLVDWVDIKV